jgi:NTE family protein
MDPASLPRPVGFVLGGGGSLGAIQVGMLQAIAEQRITPDLVVGTSVGSLNGAVVALDPEGAAERLLQVWTAMTREVVFPGGLLAQARMLQRSRTHLFPNSGLAAIIAGSLGAAATFSDLTLPLGVVTVDIATASPHVLTGGLLLPALLASAAIPGIYPWVEHEGRRLYDGGVVANVPMRQAIALGARSLVVFDCGFPDQIPPPPETLASVLLFTATITMRTQAVLEAPIAAAEVPVLYLPGPAPQYVSPLDFTRTPMFIEDAYNAARAFLQAVAVDGPGLYRAAPG